MNNQVFMASLTEEQSNRFWGICFDHRRWSDETFGNVGPVGPLKHLSKEALEAAAEPTNPTEFADCMFLMWDALARQRGFTPEKLLDAMEAKMKVNRARNWPEPSDGKPREHVKDADDVGEGEHTCPKCGRAYEATIEMEPACHARLVEGYEDAG